MRSVLTRTGLQLDPLALSVMSSRLDCAAAQPPTCATNAHVEEGMSHENVSLVTAGKRAKRTVMVPAESHGPRSCTAG